ncbi:MAG TPA: SEC-C metal-binding domain-containing protein [Isosphaeraceae bacterium]|jgi:uncharacterized protein YecA (UPF0149 family)|nr:SEC-C metal-binding domain-containing protein [Isosphaeraceae bacterium]
MDTRDGRIYEGDRLAKMIANEGDRPYMRPMAHDPTPVQRATGRVGRNDPCPCGSRKKFKACCPFKAG